MNIEADILFNDYGDIEFVNGNVLTIKTNLTY